MTEWYHSIFFENKMTIGSFYFVANVTMEMILHLLLQPSIKLVHDLSVQPNKKQVTKRKKYNFNWPHMITVGLEQAYLLKKSNNIQLFIVIFLNMLCISRNKRVAGPKAFAAGKSLSTNTCINDLWVVSFTYIHIGPNACYLHWYTCRFPIICSQITWF